MKKLVAEARRQGWRVVEKGPHYKLFPADSEKGAVVVAKTPRDVHAIKNNLARMRRAGFKWKGR